VALLSGAGLAGEVAVAKASGTLLGTVAGQELGSIERAAGDVDGDGYADLLCGAAGDTTGGAGAGAAFLVFGPVSGRVEIAAAAGASFLGAVGVGIGTALDADVDLSGDGVHDLVFGLPPGDATDANAGSVEVRAATGY
jgi:hypothetical protein